MLALLCKCFFDRLWCCRGNLFSRDVPLTASHFVILPNFCLNELFPHLSLLQPAEASILRWESCFVLFFCCLFSTPYQFHYGIICSLVVV